MPGILLTASMSVYAVLWGVKHPGVCTRYKFTLKGALVAFKDAIWALFMPIIILGGIYSGAFTPTEAAIVACVYGLFVGFVIYRQLTVKKVIEILRASTVSTAIMMIILCAVAVFSFVINTQNAAQYINLFITSLAHNKFQFWIVITIILLILGALMDTPPAIMLMGTFILPILRQYDVDPLVFGLVMIVNLGIGLNTPPVGSGLFIAKTLRSDITTKDLLSIHLLIYILICIAVMILLMACPQLITVVPTLFN
ncbi:C4-dicarboxylate TRAP transporter large permease protein DctM [bioreactor metagenome]|uniref:C4-dicarboxylate TRAP transporter large permease protein DctM n=1 Tax=bioreactor metagenome TaxID=1076179 RepID=A0A645BEK1_9ZZZZ